jgi:hypothetical protein
MTVPCLDLHEAEHFQFAPAQVTSSIPVALHALPQHIQLGLGRDTLQQQSKVDMSKHFLYL